MFRPILWAAALMVSVAAAAAQERATTYTDSRGAAVELPQGDASFADRVVRYGMGDPRPVRTERDPQAALGPPDFERAGDGHAVTLGCGGALVLAFDDNALVDVAGPDLHVFEAGPDVEPTVLAVSDNGRDWVRIGRIAGGTASVDIAPVAGEDASFRYVRLTDGREGCDSRWPGADIDAVAAIGSAPAAPPSASVADEAGGDVPAQVDRATDMTDARATTYEDGRGVRVDLPLGDASFADRAVRYATGDPSPLRTERDPQAALGAPDFDRPGDGRAVTLGCGGMLVLAFADNALVDVAGADLHVFEVGPDVEPTRLAISNDGRDWIRLGRISGGTASVDIAGEAPAGTSFRYVRLTDEEEACGGRWPGADIDAVAAIGSAARLVLAGEVLFPFDSADLRPRARKVLRSFAVGLSPAATARIEIVGHTDAVGPADYNADLSLRRARAVRRFLASTGGVSDVAMTTRGAGEAEPVASNDTERSRARNRRVELIVVPAR